MATDAISRRYELLNRQLQQKERSQLQQEQEGLQRRFASIGGLGSGASIKTQQIAAQESARRLGEGRANLGISESQERQQQEELEKQRAFQTSERLGGQEFSAGQAGLQRGFLTSERLGGQEFGAGQAALQRAFSTSERLGGQEFGAGQAALQRGFLTSERLGGQEFSAGQADLQRGFLTSERLGGQEFAKGERLGSQDFQSSQNALARRLQEAGLTGFLDGQEILQARESRLGREQQAEQFGSQLEESKRQAMEKESLGRDELRQQKNIADATRKLQQNIANKEIDFKNANLAWEKFVFGQEFPINQKIAFENLKVQKQSIAKQDEGILTSLYREIFGGW